MNFRQVHADFHTSEKIPDIGTRFSKEQFQEALKTGCVNSITVFSKCHHGWAYHPSKANEPHPHLKIDLLGAQIEAAHEIGVKTPVYLSVGFDEKLARRHPEWLARNRDETVVGTPDFARPGYHKFCLNTPYLEIVLAQIKEVAESYDADGIFLDIVGVQPCYCQSCIHTLLERGLDPYDEQNIYKLAEEVYETYARRVRETVDAVKPGLPVFHNCGHIKRGNRAAAHYSTHLELESLPTGGWGYDHFPLSARYAQTLGMEYLGMTGKFHTTWGEFGGYKHKNAIRYEAALSVANGAKCSIGDQIHPSGAMDLATYKLIGAGYREVEQKEPWLDGVVPVTDIGLLSAEAMQSAGGTVRDENTTAHDAGAVRILLEGNYLFNVIDAEEDFSHYRVLILPDVITISAALKNKLNRFVQQGGKILAAGKSGLWENKTDFALDFGVSYEGVCSFRPSYFHSFFTPEDMEEAAYIFYAEGENIKLRGGRELGRRELPYFNRETLRFCSHQHAPDSGENGGPGMVQGRDGIYIAWQIFEDYFEKGSLILKKTVCHALDLLLGEDKTLTTNLPAQGIVTLMDQPRESRLVNHLLYAAPVRRGQNVEVIEDIIPLVNIQVRLKTKRAVHKVYLAPQMQEIPFTREGDFISYLAPRLECHQMVVLDYTDPREQKGKTD